jgi:hypothetical protein
MHAQQGGHAFRSGQRNHFAVICLVPDFCAPRPSVFAAGFLSRRAACGGASLCPHPFNFDFMVLRALRFEPIMVAR